MNYLYLEEIDSTNKYAKDNISSILDETVVYTYRQTSGRGRLERKWEYLNNLTYKARLHDTAPFINLNNRALKEDEIEFVDVFKG